MLRRLLFLLVFFVPSAGSGAEASFRPIASPAHTYQGGWEHFVGGGVAGFDCNGDALPELFVAGGSEPAVLLHNASVRGLTVQFRKSTTSDLALRGVTGAYPLDIDSDGNVDLVVLRAGTNILFRGDGKCRFSPMADVGFSSSEKWTVAFSATWEAGSRLPTLAFGNYVDRTHPQGPFGTCESNELLRPQDGRYALALTLTPSYCALSMLFSDWGRNGRADLRISNDRHYYGTKGGEQLWAMESVPRLYTQKDGWQDYRIWGMGIASRDINGDGLLDVYLTSMADQKLQVLESRERPVFRDVPFAYGATAHRPYTGDDGRPSTGWHAVFGDVQNDGHDDIFVAKGNVDQMPESAMNDPNNLLIGLPDGTFAEKGDVAGLASMHRGRGAAMMDFNLDGLLDIAVVNRRAPLQIYHNVSRHAGNWTAIKLRQQAPNVDAIGAWIELRVKNKLHIRELTVGGGHAGGTLGPEHFGLGAAQSAAIRVVWPDGSISHWRDLATTNKPLLITREGDKLRITAY